MHTSGAFAVTLSFDASSRLLAFSRSSASPASAPVSSWCFPHFLFFSLLPLLFLFNENTENTDMYGRRMGCVRLINQTIFSRAGPKKNCRDLVFARRNRCNRCGTPRPPRVVSTPIAAGGGPAATATAAGVEGAAAAGGAAGVATAAPQPQAAAGWQQAGAKVAVPAVTPKPAVAVAVAPPPVSDGWATVGKKAQAAKAKAQAAQTVAAPRGPASKGTSVPGAGAGAGAGTKAGDRTTPAANAASNSADFPGVNSTAAATATSSASATASKLNDEKAKRKRRRGKRGGTRTSEFSEEVRFMLTPAQ